MEEIVTTTMTLRSIRTAFDYTQEEVARYCKISPYLLENYEKDTSLIPIDIIRKLNKLFSIPLAIIYIGKESDKKN